MGYIREGLTYDGIQFIIVEGYRYRFDKFVPSGVTHWRCMTSPTCDAKVDRSDDIIVQYYGEHNHPPPDLSHLLRGEIAFLLVFTYMY